MKPAPLVIAVTGPPGSGKSTTGEEIARLLGAALLDQDSMTNPLVQVISALIEAEGMDDPRLATLVREPRYEGLLRVAIDCVRAGTPVVLVAPFTAERRDSHEWEALRSRIDAAGGSAHLVWMRISPSQLRRRLQERNAHRDRAKLADPDAYLAGVDFSPPAAPFIEVDAGTSPARQADRVLERLRHGAV